MILVLFVLVFLTKSKEARVCLTSIVDEYESKCLTNEYNIRFLIGHDVGFEDALSKLDGFDSWRIDVLKSATGFDLDLSLFDGVHLSIICIDGAELGLKVGNDLKIRSLTLEFDNSQSVLGYNSVKFGKSSLKTGVFGTSELRIIGKTGTVELRNNEIKVLADSFSVPMIDVGNSSPMKVRVFGTSLQLQDEVLIRSSNDNWNCNDWAENIALDDTRMTVKCEDSRESSVRVLKLTQRSETPSRTPSASAEPTENAEKAKMDKLFYLVIPAAVILLSAGTVIIVFICLKRRREKEIIDEPTVYQHALLA